MGKPAANLPQKRTSSQQAGTVVADKMSAKERKMKEAEEAKKEKELQQKAEEAKAKEKELQQKAEEKAKAALALIPVAVQTLQSLRLASPRRM